MFKIYLKQLKNYIFELSKIHRINFFQSNSNKNSNRKFSISIICRTRKKNLFQRLCRKKISNAHDSMTKIKILKIILIIKISKIIKMISKISKMLSTISMTIRIKTILIIKIILIKHFMKIRITKIIDMIIFIFLIKISIIIL